MQKFQIDSSMFNIKTKQTSLICYNAINPKNLQTVLYQKNVSYLSFKGTVEKKVYRNLMTLSPLILCINLKAHSYHLLQASWARQIV